MIDLTTRSGKYRIAEDARGEAVISRRDGVWSSLRDDLNVALLELCTELGELRAAGLPKPVCNAYKSADPLGGCLCDDCGNSPADHRAKQPAEPPLPLGHEFKPWPGSRCCSWKLLEEFSDPCGHFESDHRRK